MKIITKLISNIILFLTIFSVGLPIWLDVFLVVILIIIFKKFFQKLIIIFLTFLFIFISSYYFKSDGIYYRPHEKYSLENSYKKNVNISMTMNYGDLAAMDPLNKKKVQEFRTVRFITDKYGYRNDKTSIDDAKIILIGDSLITGASNDQKYIPNRQLQEQIGLSVAQISFAGYSNIYESLLLEFINTIKNKKVIVFYSEGNAFEVDWKKYSDQKFINNKYLSIEREKDEILKKIYSKDNLFIKTIRKNSNDINKLIFSSFGINEVLYKNIGNNLVGFYKLYSFDKKKTHIIKNKKLLSIIDGIFFIPTKQRTYLEYFEAQLKDNHIKYLKNEYAKLNVPVIDLTEVFQKKSKEYIKKGQYLYWKDDTHWNPIGIKIAMQCVAEFISYKEDKSSFNCEQ